MNAALSDELPEDLVDARAAAELLRLCVPVLYRWRAKGKVRAWRRGGRWFFSRAELRRLFVADRPAATLPPTGAERERQAALARSELRAKGWPC
jgi:hypothetical protein